MPAKGRKLTFFYLNGDLHKSLHINRGLDQIMTWNFATNKRMTYVYSDVRRLAEIPYTTQQVAKMVGRNIVSIERAILDGSIKPPQRTKKLSTGNPGPYMWNEQQIMDLHDYFASLHYGAPRKDEKNTPKQTLTPKNQLRAMVRQETVLYVQNDKGEFIPTWEA